jgi:hypothetical protein
MSNKLYSKLKEGAKDNVVERLKLGALYATLEHFDVSTQNRDVCAEALLRMEILTREKSFTPADGKTEKLLEMLDHYKGLL